MEGGGRGERKEKGEEGRRRAQEMCIICTCRAKHVQHSKRLAQRNNENVKVRVNTPTGGSFVSGAVGKECK